LTGRSARKRGGGADDPSAPIRMAIDVQQDIYGLTGLKKHIRIKVQSYQEDGSIQEKHRGSCIVVE